METAIKVKPPASDNSGSTDDSSNKRKDNSSIINELGVSIATEAYSYVDILPYIYGGTSLTTGADCSGFTQSIYRECGVAIPRTSTEQASGGKTINEDELQVGDLVFYTGINDVNGTIGHVAIYVGYGKIVHEANSSRGCQLDDLNYTTPVKYVTYLRK